MGPWPPRDALTLGFIYVNGALQLADALAARLVVDDEPSPQATLQAGLPTQLGVATGLRMAGYAHLLRQARDGGHGCSQGLRSSCSHTRRLPHLAYENPGHAWRYEEAASVPSHGSHTAAWRRGSDTVALRYAPCFTAHQFALFLPRCNPPNGTNCDLLRSL